MTEVQYLEADIWKKVNAVEGWLAHSAAHFSWSLVKHQASLSIKGPLVEFGVFKGKYLALLAAASNSTQETLFGYDGFFAGYNRELASEWIEAARLTMVNNVASVADVADRLSIVRANTLTLSAERVLSEIGGRVSFASVDAGHEANEVYHDMSVMSDVLADGGIIAADDVFNSICPGVAEGICRYLSSEQEPKIAAFATVGNKVFFTNPNHHGHYLNFAKKFIESCDEGFVLETRQLIKLNANIGYVPKFFGNEIVPFSN